MPGCGVWGGRREKCKAQRRGHDAVSGKVCVRRGKGGGGKDERGGEARAFTTDRPHYTRCWRSTTIINDKRGCSGPSSALLLACERMKRHPDGPALGSAESKELSLRDPVRCEEYKAAKTHSVSLKETATRDRRWRQRGRSGWRRVQWPQEVAPHTGWHTRETWKRTGRRREG